MIRRRDFVSGTAVAGAASAGSLLSANSLYAGAAEREPIGQRTQLDEGLLGQIAGDLALMSQLDHLQTGSQGDIALAHHLEQALTAAGFATMRQQVTAPLAQVDQAKLSWRRNGADHTAALWPQRPLHFTASDGVSGPLVIWRTAEVPVTAITIPPGAIVLAVLPYERHSQLIRALPLASLQALAAAGAAAVVLITDGPTGAAIALNCPQDTSQFPRLPLATLGPAAARPLLAHAQTGGQAHMILSGQVRTGESYNLWGRRGPKGGPLVIVSTPRTGWTAALAERGPGIASFHAMMKWAPARFPDHEFLFLSTAAHEYDNAGSARFLTDLAPSPDQVRLWLHLGAGFAARDFHELGEYRLLPLPTPDPQRFLVASEALVPALRKAFVSEPGLGRVYPASAGAVGELNEIIAAGYPSVMGLLGGHRFHHVTDDRIDKTDPAFIAAVVAALQAALPALLAGSL